VLAHWAGLDCEPSLSSSICLVAGCLVLLGDLHSDQLLVGGSLARFGGIDSKCGLATMLPPIKSYWEKHVPGVEELDLGIEDEHVEQIGKEFAYVESAQCRPWQLPTP
jgi:hypothetical protein